MIDIDKFIASLLQWGHLGIPKDAMCFALKEQGLEFRDGSISKVEPSIPEIVEEHFDEMLEDKSNPDNLHQYLYGSAEDEDIRKDIIWCLKHSGVKESNPINPHVTTIAKDAIAWLEKQGGHANFRNKIQIGDKVTRNEDGVLVNLSQLKRIAKPTENKGKHSMGISEATKQKLEDNLNKALEKETSESWDKFLDEQGKQKPNKCMYSKDNYTDEDRKVLCDGCEENCKFKQKFSWSEEDEERLSDAIFFVREYQIPTRDKRLFNAAKKTEDWLRTFKGKVQPQPKQEWNEEDKYLIYNIEQDYRGKLNDNPPESLRPYYNKVIHLLKSLKERYTWKPSEEQMKGIECAIKTLQYQLNVGDKRLNSLYDDLKKLKG